MRTSRALCCLALILGGAADQLFGGGLRLEGSVLAAAARLTIDTSIVHLLRRSSSGAWDCEASIASPTDDAQDRFGWTLDVAGDVLAIGAHHKGDHPVWSGAVCMYRCLGHEQCLATGRPWLGF